MKLDPDPLREALHGVFCSELEYHPFTSVSRAAVLATRHSVPRGISRCYPIPIRPKALPCSFHLHPSVCKQLLSLEALLRFSFLHLQV